jgi:SAM-dependent methyltransferase
VADDPLSRRALLRLDFRRLRGDRPDPGAVKASVAWRWEAGAEALHRAWEPLAAVLCDVAEVGEGMRVLDAATGDGNVALEAARRGAVVVGYDLSPAQLDRARARPDADVVTWATGDVESLPDDDETYDVVLSAYGAALAPRPRRTVRELLRVLRPGGLLVLAAPAPRSLAARAIRLAQDGPGALPPGIPSPASWGREDVALERVAAVAPGTDAEISHHPLALSFASEAEAWDAFAGPFGLSDTTRDAFADLVAARSDSLARVEIEEPVTLLVARRG